MTSVTYQTLVPAELTDFCEAMGELFGQMERHLYRDIQQGKKIAPLKREYQLEYKVNARFFNGVNDSLRGKIKSREESYKLQIEELTRKIEGLESKIASVSKKLDNALPDCSIGKKHAGYRKRLKFQIHCKKRKLSRLRTHLKKLQNSQPSLLFGSRRLWEAQFNLESNGYATHEEWLADWRKARSNQFLFVGSHDERGGCQNCILENNNLYIRVPLALEKQYGQQVPEFQGKYVIFSGVKFLYGQANIDYALEKKQAMTYRFVRKDKQWYLSATTDRIEVPTQTKKPNGCLGIDFNPSVIGWAVCNGEGNLQKYGQIKINLQDRSTNQTKATLGDAVKNLLEIATKYNCPISVENLDFSKKKASMKEQGVSYSRMLSNFSYSSFYELLNSRTYRYGVELIKVNPAFSSLVGLVKFMSLYGMSSDTAAALVLARRALGFSERLPAKYARFGAVQKKRHVWSFWGALGKAVKNAYKKLNKRLSRHDYFASRTTNSRVVVILLEGQAFKGKSKQQSKTKAKTLPLAGGTPASEPSAALFG